MGIYTEGRKILRPWATEKDPHLKRPGARDVAQ